MPERARLLADRREGGGAALRLMEGHLARHDFFVGDYGIAGVALCACARVTQEGGFPLDDFPSIRAWPERLRAEPGFVTMSGRR